MIAARLLILATGLCTLSAVASGCSSSDGTENGGTTGTTGAAGTTGSGRTTGAAGTTGTSGATGNTGGARSTGATGGANGGDLVGMSGAGGSGSGGAVSPRGSAAKTICTSGMTYGSPLAGVGTVSAINAPSGDSFVFLEGPVWISTLGTLFFSDNDSMPTERIFKMLPPSTTPAVLIADSGSNGLAVDNSNRIVAADQRRLRIVTFDPTTGQIVGTPISTGTAKPNDVIVRSDNNIYFTDPDTGFYRISPTGTVSAAMKLTMANQPNGIELSLDENTLLVGDVSNKTIAKYTLAADGTVMTATGTAFVAQTMHGLVDGMCIDCAGNVYASTSGGLDVYSPTGAYLGTLPTGASSNCTFGGADRKTIYVAARTQLKTVTVSIPGLPD